jgi:hypothetical protein
MMDAFAGNRGPLGLLTFLYQYLAVVLDISGIPYRAKCKWLMTVGDHKIIREVYAGFPQSSITSAMSAEKMFAGARRGRLRHLLIRNYEPPKIPLYTATASQLPLMDLFSLG